MPFQERETMQDWNVVISVKESGFKDAFRKLSRFGPIGKTGFFNVLFLKVYDIPRMLRILSEWLEDDPHALAFLSRMIPVTHTFTYQSSNEFEERAKEIVLAWAPDLAGKSFHVRMHRRGFKGKLSGLEEEQFLDKVLIEEIEKAGSPGRITFEDPDAIIVIETISQWAGISLWSRDELKRYPFIKLD
jgi:tRNA(Ser,Leu) C12 N-acetylase TAN1